MDENNTTTDAPRIVTYRASDLTITEQNTAQPSPKEHEKKDEIVYASAIVKPPTALGNNDGSTEKQALELMDGSPYGWVIVFASFVTQMTTMGFLNTYGVFQHYYLTVTFKGATTTSFQLSWIASLVNTFMDITGPFTGTICDTFGHRPAALLGVAIMVLSLVLAAFATQVWHLYLSQGILYGVGTSLTYFASMTLPAQWFRKHRGLATGVMFSGGGLGGLWMAPVVGWLLRVLGQRRTLLVVAGVHVCVLVPVCLLFRTRCPAAVSSPPSSGEVVKDEEEGEKERRREGRGKRVFVDLSIMKDKRFALLFVASVFVMCGYFTPFYFITSYAGQHGADSTTSAILAGSISSSSAIGRIGMGFLSDRIGFINTLCIISLSASLSILLLWGILAPATANAIPGMFMFTIAYGFCCGAFMSTAMAVAGVVVGGVERLASVTGVLFVGMAVGCLVGTPTSGAILDGVGIGKKYGGVVVWASGLMFLGGLLVLGVEVMTSRRVFVKV